MKDAVARRLASRATSVNPLPTVLSAEISGLIIPPSTSVIQTTGVEDEGVGAALWVSDALADADLATAHPAFCKETGNGRFFRLLPVHNRVTCEQAGIPSDPAQAHSVATNAQPALQAAVDYLEEIAPGYDWMTIRFVHDEYSIRTPTRTSDPTAQWETHHDGKCVLVSKRIKFEGLPGKGTRLRQRMPDGGTFEGTTPGTHFQIVNGQVWRGPMIYLLRDAVDPGAVERLSGFGADNIVFDGGTMPTLTATWPATPATGVGFDVTHAAIKVRATGHGGNLYLFDCVFEGWRGESIYGSNDYDSEWVMERCLARNSNGSGYNPNYSKVRWRDNVAEYSQLGAELRLSGPGFIRNLEIRNCPPPDGYNGLSAYPGTPLSMDTSDVSGTVAAIDKQFTIDGLVVRNANPSRAISVGGGISGKRWELWDCPVEINRNGSTKGNLFLDIRSIRHTSATTYSAVALLGSTTPGTVDLDNVVINIECDRSGEARAASRTILSPCTWGGSLGGNVRVNINGAPECQRAPGPTFTQTDYAPSFTGDMYSTSDTANASQNVQTTPALALRGPVWHLSTTSSDIHSVTSLPTTLIAKGTRVWVWNNNSPTGGVIRFPTSVSGTIFNGDVYLQGARGFYIRWNGAQWEPEGKVIRAERIPFQLSTDETTAHTVGTGKYTAIMPFAGRPVGVSMVAAAAPTGAALIMDIQEEAAGSFATIVSTRPQINAAATTGGGGAVFSDTALANGARLRFDITQIGSTVAGAGVKGYLLAIPT
jgi:hypothetical protein